MARRLVLMLALSMCAGLIPAQIRLEQPAAVGMPVWLKIPPRDRLSDQYPFRLRTVNPRRFRLAPGWRCATQRAALGGDPRAEPAIIQFRGCGGEPVRVADLAGWAGPRRRAAALAPAIQV